MPTLKTFQLEDIESTDTEKDVDCTERPGVVDWAVIDRFDFGEETYCNANTMLTTTGLEFVKVIDFDTTIFILLVNQTFFEYPWSTKAQKG